MNAAVIGRGSSTLTFVRDGDRAETLVVVLVDGGLRAELSIEAGYIGYAGLGTFFAELKSAWRGWEGAIEYESLEHDLQLRAIHSGHVVIEVRLRESTDVCIANDLESSAYPSLLASTRPLFPSAAAVGLAMYRRVRWPAEVLASVTNYTHEELPILREAVGTLTQTTDNFFAYDVAGISDREPVIDELVRHSRTFVMPAHLFDEED